VKRPLNTSERENKTAPNDGKSFTASLVSEEQTNLPVAKTQASHIFLSLSPNFWQNTQKKSFFLY